MTRYFLSGLTLQLDVGKLKDSLLIEIASFTFLKPYSFYTFEGSSIL